MLREVVVVEPAVAVRQHGANVAVQRAHQAPVVLAVQPRVHVAVQQVRLLLAHALKVGVGDAELLCQLALGQLGDPELRGSVRRLDRHLARAAAVGAKAHQRRRHDHVLLGLELTAQFLGQVNKGTSSLHG